MNQCKAEKHNATNCPYALVIHNMKTLAVHISDLVCWVWIKSSYSNLKDPLDSRTHSLI